MQAEINEYKTKEIELKKEIQEQVATEQENIKKIEKEIAELM